MVQSFRVFYSSIGRKLLMSLTGLFLCLFLLEHLYTNLLLYKLDQGKAFTEFSQFLQGNLVIRIIEYVLFGSIIIHVLDGLMLTIRNRKARPVRYEVSRQAGNSSWFSRNMGLTGSVIFIFLVIHMRTFFVPHRFGHSETSMAWDVAKAFESSTYASFYIIAMVLLGFHLNHGFQSAWQTLGLNNKKYMPLLRYFGTGFALLMMIGFSSFPILFYFDLFGVATNILQP